MTIPSKAAARDDGTNLVVTQTPIFAADLEVVLTFGPGEIVGPLESCIPVDERAVVAFANIAKPGDLKYGNAPEKWILRDALETEFADDVSHESALLDVARVEIVHAELKLIHLIRAENHGVSEYALLAEDRNTVSLIKNCRGDVLWLLCLAEAEEISLVLDSRPIGAGGELITVRATSFVVQIVIGDSKCATACLVGQGIKIVQHFLRDGTDAAGGNCGVGEDLSGIHWISNAAWPVKKTEVARPVAGIRQGSCLGKRSTLAQAFVVEHEEQFVLAVKEFWNDHRTREGTAKLIALKGRIDSGEEVTGVKIGVT